MIGVSETRRHQISDRWERTDPCSPYQRTASDAASDGDRFVVQLSPLRATSRMYIYTPEIEYAGSHREREDC